MQSSESERLEGVAGSSVKRMRRGMESVTLSPKEKEKKRGSDEGRRRETGASNE